MTYKELLNELQKLSDEQLKQDVTILSIDAGEFSAAQGGLVYADNTDVLDKNHPYLMC